MYIFLQGSYTLNGMMTVIKYEGKKILLTCTHQLQDDVSCFVAVGDKFTQINFTHHYKPDVSFMICPNFIKVEGSLSEIGYPDPQETDYVLYTRKIPTLEPVSVWCSQATWDNYDTPAYLLHVSDTFSGQCGSPYMSNNKVVALHNSTDHNFNKGIVIPSKIRTDF